VVFMASEGESDCVSINQNLPAPSIRPWSDNRAKILPHSVLAGWSGHVSGET